MDDDVHGPIKKVLRSFPQAFSKWSRKRLKSLKILKNDTDKSKVAASLSFYANILDNTGDYETAVEVLNKAEKLQQRSKDKTPLVFTYLRTGNIYRKFLAGTDKSFFYYNKALKISKELKNDFLKNENFSHK